MTVKLSGSAPDPLFGLLDITHATQRA